MAAKDGDSTCTNCEDVIPFESIFKCVTCSDKVTDPDLPLELLCDGCIKSHIKKNHKLADSRGYEPPVCKEHYQLCSEFCKTCEKVCCTKCLRDHSKHEFEPLKEKAAEIRAKVFEALTQWELYEKPARAKKELVSAIMISQMEDVEILLDYVEQKIDEMKTNIVREVRGKLVDFEDSEKEVEAHIVDVVDLQQELRNLLQTSEGAMVEKFKETWKVINNRLQQQKHIERMKFDDYDQIPDAGCLDSFFETSFVEVKKELEKASREIQDCRNSSKSVFTSDVICQSYFSSLDGDVILIECSLIDYSIYHFTVNSGAQLINQREIATGSLPVCIVSVIYHINDSYILMLFEDKSTILLSRFTGKKVENIHVTYPAVSKFITPFIVANKVEWIFWEALTKALLSTYDGSRIKCQSKPSNLLSTFSSEFLGYFERREKEIIAVKRRAGNLVAEIIPFSVHGLNAIDCISYLNSYSGTTYMILWSKESNVSVIFNHGARNTWVVKEKVHWGCGPVIEIFTLKRFLVPQVCRASAKTHEDVFLVSNEFPSGYEEVDDDDYEEEEEEEKLGTRSASNLT